jgi:hypothetical protein
MADLTKLDSKALQAFIDNDVTNFIADIAAMRAAGQSPPALYDYGANPGPLLLMGQMGADDATGGKAVLANAQSAAKAVDQVFNKHKTAFTDLKRELETVITTMLKTQGDSLATVDGQKFLTAIGNYDFDLSGSTAGAGQKPPTTP